MKASAKYDFERCMKTRFALRRHTGSCILGFPSMWVAENHPSKGKAYIIFNSIWGSQNNPPDIGFSHALYFGRDRPKSEKLCTGLNFFPEFPYKTYGAYKDHAFLIQFSKDWTRITIWVFKGMREMRLALFQKWTAGELVETVETDILPIPA